MDNLVKVLNSLIFNQGISLSAKAAYSFESRHTCIKISFPIQFIPTLSEVCNVKKHSCQHAILDKGKHPWLPLAECCQYPANAAHIPFAQLVSNSHHYPLELQIAQQLLAVAPLLC